MVKFAEGASARSRIRYLRRQFNTLWRDRASAAAWAQSSFAIGSGFPRRRRPRHHRPGPDARAVPLADWHAALPVARRRAEGSEQRPFGQPDARVFFCVTERVSPAPHRLGNQLFYRGAASASARPPRAAVILATVRVKPARCDPSCGAPPQSTRGVRNRMPRASKRVPINSMTYRASKPQNRPLSPGLPGDCVDLGSFCQNVELTGVSI